MKFSSDFIESVRNGNNIVDIIGLHTELKRAGSGGRLIGLCPFPDHNEKTPSFSVSEDRQFYYCFGCKSSGDIYSFLKAIQGMSFYETVEYLAQRAGIELPTESISLHGKAKHDEKKQALQINKLARQFFHKSLLSLPSKHPVKQYCVQRKISDEMIQRLQLGYASEDWEGLSQYLKKEKQPLKVAHSIGLIKQRSRGPHGFYDLFRNRLMFPIIGRMDHHLGFGGRLIGEGQPKYLNSPESFIFHKGKTLYGLNDTAKYIRTEGYAIVVEGYMDLLALQSSGIDNVVATLGTALTENHVQQLRQLTQKVVVLFDGDTAGQEGAQRSLPILLKQQLLPRICLLPGGVDPDDFIKSKGSEALRSAIQGSKDLFIYSLDRIINEIGIKETSDKILVLDQLMPIYTSIADPRLKEIYLNEISRRLNIEKKLGETRTPSIWENSKKF